MKRLQLIVCGFLLIAVCGIATAREWWEIDDPPEFPPTQYVEIYGDAYQDAYIDAFLYPLLAEWRVRPSARLLRQLRGLFRDKIAGRPEDAQAIAEQIRLLRDYAELGNLAKTDQGDLFRAKARLLNFIVSDADWNAKKPKPERFLHLAWHQLELPDYGRLIPVLSPETKTKPEKDALYALDISREMPPYEPVAWALWCMKMQPTNVILGWNTANNHSMQDASVYPAHTEGIRATVRAIRLLSPETRTWVAVGAYTKTYKAWMGTVGQEGDGIALWGPQFFPAMERLNEVFRDMGRPTFIVEFYGVKPWAKVAPDVFEKQMLETEAAAERAGFSGLCRMR